MRLELGRTQESRKRASSSLQGALPFLAVGGALLLRLLRIDFQPLWWDEGWSLYFARSDPGTMLGLTAVDIHPPLYYLLLHFWTAVLGASPLVSRLFSVAVGVATVGLLFFTGRRLLGPVGGAVAAALLALSPFHVYYSQEVRMYGLVTLLGLAALWFALDLAEGHGGLASWLGYVLSAAAALHTQYYAGFLLLGLNVAVGALMLRRRRPARVAWAWLGAQAATVILFLPWAWYAGGRLLTYVRFKVGIEADNPFGLPAYLGRHLAALTSGHLEGRSAGAWWLGLLPLALLLIGSGSLLFRRQGPRPRCPESLWAPLAMVVVTLLCGFAVNRALPFNPPRGERLMLLVLPAYLLLLTAGLLLLWRRWRTVAVAVTIAFGAVALFMLSTFYTVPRYADDDYRPLAGRLRALARPEDAVLCVHPWQVGYLQSYLPSSVRPSLVLTPREVIPRERQLWADDPVLLAADLDSLLSERGRLWFADHRAMGRVLESQIQDHLVQQFYPARSEWYGKNTVLSLFVSGEPQPVQTRAHYGDWLTLERAAVETGPHQAGWDSIAVDLSWKLHELPAADHLVGLRLVGEQGLVWAQRDAMPHDGLEPFGDWPIDVAQIDHHALVVPAGTPPGEYRVALRVYRSDDLTVLPAEMAGGTSQEVLLGTVRVVRPAASPPVEALEAPEPLDLTFGSRLRLVGYGPAAGYPLRPGEEVRLDLYWQALEAPGEDLLPRLELLDGDSILAQVTTKPVMGTYPTAWWAKGELVRDPHTLSIPAPVPAGRYDLAVSLVRAADGEPATLRTGGWRRVLLTVQVVGRAHQFLPPSPQHGQTATLGTAVELAGYDLPGAEPGAGTALELILHWHALASLDRPYYSFVHLIAGDGSIVAQHDGPPGMGDLPAMGWLPGEYLADPHRLELPCNLPAGEYRLGVGLYDPATEQRLGERILLDSPVTVRPGLGDGCR